MFYIATEHVGGDGTDFLLELPDRGEVCRQLAEQIRGDIASEANHGSLPMVVDFGSSTSHLHSSYCLNYLSGCEKVVRDGSLDSIFESRMDLPEDQRIGLHCFQILAEPLLGNPRNKKYVDAAEFAKMVVDRLEKRIPLQFIVPAFPFKDQNPFRTASEARHVDLGEVALLARLHSLALALAQVYPYGIEWVIVSDGLVYSDFLGIDRSEAILYRERLREWRNRLNLQQTIHILDFSEAVERLGTFDLQGDNGVITRATFETVRQYLCDIVMKEMEESSNQLFVAKFNTFVRGMAWNINTRDLMDQYGRASLWAALSDPLALSNTDVPAPLAVELKRRSTVAALNYSCFNLAAKLLQVMSRVFPQGIRSTVHPKPTQIAIPQLGDAYPWNGIAFVRPDRPMAKSVETVNLFDVVKRCRVVACYHVGDESPFFFQEAQAEGS